MDRRNWLELAVYMRMSSLSPASGSTTGSTVVTLSGANLELATQCRFDKTVVPSTVLSATQITCEAPVPTTTTSNSAVSVIDCVAGTRLLARVKYRNREPVTGSLSQCCELLQPGASSPSDTDTLVSSKMLFSADFMRFN